LHRNPALHLRRHTCCVFGRDATVLAAYGFSAKKDVLAQLLALNSEVVGKIERGEPVTAPGAPKTYPDPK